MKTVIYCVFLLSASTLVVALNKHITVSDRGECLPIIFLTRSSEVLLIFGRRQRCTRYAQYAGPLNSRYIEKKSTD